MIMIRPMTPSVVSPQRSSSTGTKIRLLLWKNFLIQTRHKLHTIVDICLPVLFFLICAYIRKSIEPQNHPDPMKYSPNPIDVSTQLWEQQHSYSFLKEYSSIEERRLLFTPNTKLFKSLMEQVAKDLNLDGVDGIDINNTETIFRKRKPVAAVVFHHSNDVTKLPEKLSYSLRFPAELRKSPMPSSSDPDRFNWHTNKLFPNNAFDEPIELSELIESTPSYYKEGFLTIQNAIARQFIKMSNSLANPMPDIKLKRFPYPSFILDPFLQQMQSIAPLFFLFFFNYTFMNTIRFISNEKEKQLKESMKIMGLPMWIHWFSWFVRTIIMLSISMIGIALLLKRAWFGATLAIFPNSNIICLLIFFICYSICITTYSFVISASFATTKAATTVSSFAWYLSYVPYALSHGNFNECAGWIKILSCFCPNSAMGYGLMLIVRLEESKLGLTWSTFFKVLFDYDTLSLVLVCGIMLFASLLFFGFALYLENIFPGSYGIAKPWYYLFKRDFWQYKKFDDHHGEYNGEATYNELKSNNFESEPMNQQAGIEIRNMSKMFGNKLVVDNLSMNMYSSQITVLLGHNGAGKTTTISMLAGMIEPNSGTAMIDGYDIRTNTDMARNSMGFCPQHNILFDQLTVREHIILYSQLKGLNGIEAEHEAARYAQLLGLNDKINAISKTLSGGQQRKLSIGIALCGKSKIVFLDEPTSGMDVNARRNLWDVLLADKENRTILLSTHYMDEADVLGDRIAIMAEGELQCCGSSFFLKKRFGTGYHLICAKDENCNANAVTDVLREYLPDIRVENENDTEVFYELPDNKVHMFKNIFKDLEDNEKQLKLKSFGVSLTTLEEIFLKVSKGSVNASESANGQSNLVNGENETHLTMDDNEFLLDGNKRLMAQVSAMFKKRYLCWLGSWKSFLYYNLFVLICLISVAFDLSQLFKRSNLPPFDLTLNAYRNPIVFVQDTHNLNQTSNAAQILNQLQDHIRTHTPAELITLPNDMDEDIIAYAESALNKYQSNSLTAASSTDDNTILAWFNNQAYHTAGISLNLLHNAIVKTLLGNDYGVQVINEPFTFWDLPKNSTIPDTFGSVDVFGIAFTAAIGFAMSVYTAAYTMFYIKENECKSKLMQYVSGMNTIVFWLTSMLWDLLTFTFTIIIIIIVLAISQHSGFKSFIDLSQLFLILFTYALAMMPILFLISLVFSQPSTAVSVISIVNTIIMVFFWVDIVAKLLPNYIRFFVMAYPMCSLLDALMNFMEFKSKSSTDPSWDKNLIFGWEKPSIGQDLTYMIVTTVFFFCLMIIIERGALKRLISLIMKVIPRTLPERTEEMDNDVADEKARIDSMSEFDLKSQALTLQDVSKFYQRFLAVNQISFVVKKGECFGLLGNNGAGKTTIFKMLIGEVLASRGEIFANGFNQKTDLYRIYENIGYCPQFDALLEDLTCRQTLEIFAMIHGVPRSEIHNYVQAAARNLDFIQHIDKKVSQLSGGNKRKLSTTISLIGNPSIIFLDEPTTGMDPATKRNLWNVIIKLRESGKSIVLTSHSMEECEALCTRLTVLVNGDCKCLGSVQHLKNKFTRGFELKVKIHQNGDESLQISEAKQFIPRTFDGAVLREEYQGILTYTVPTENMKWSTLFGIMENAKRTINIEDYSISQNSLEQVVLGFIKSQRARENGK